MVEMKRYPRTQHLADSRLQPGDHDLEARPFSTLLGKHVIVEEKVDGANCGISFDEGLEPRLQSRGHYLVGGPRERQWGLLKRWVQERRDALLNILEDRYVLYAEWVYAKHTVFYDLLPSYLLEFDVLDRSTGHFLSTARRRQLLAGSGVVSVKVLYDGDVGPGEGIRTLADLRSLVRPSYFKSGIWRRALEDSARSAGVDPATVVDQTDKSDDMEGLYIKVEGDTVEERYKWVRHSFLTSIADSETHWSDRPIVPNLIAPDAMF